VVYTCSSAGKISAALPAETPWLGGGGSLPRSSSFSLARPAKEMVHVPGPLLGEVSSPFVCAWNRRPPLPTRGFSFSLKKIRRESAGPTLELGDGRAHHGAGGGTCIRTFGIEGGTKEAKRDKLLVFQVMAVFWVMVFGKKKNEGLVCFPSWPSLYLL